MEKLNVTCSTCKIGKVVTLNISQMGCDTCNITFTSYDYDNLLKQHIYNNQFGADVQMLNKNGTWTTTHERGVKRFNTDEFNLNEYSNGKKFLQKVVDSNMNDKYYYFQQGANFFMLHFNNIHNMVTICDYKACEERMSSLMNHFFGVKA